MSLETKIKQQEGFSRKLYQDTEGIWTIGWGTNIETIDEEEAEFLFTNRLKKVKAEVDKEIPWAKNLSAARRDVIYNMAYNMGVPRLCDFKQMLGHARLGEWKEAAIAGLDSIWARQVKGRAQTLMRQLESGEELN